uniref:Uncharacterized protein n=1 Tax=Craspedostauros australis TaxID=1486917 RepID=A0A7S0F6K6_9STRA|mmetsp:Transcript_873/g.2487  ORF Transcript_873/g.2487 Transcript_873/m.2487 type:complete len:217 (+) Transcript_873:453-1103(+)
MGYSWKMAIIYLFPVCLRAFIAIKCIHSDAMRWGIPLVIFMVVRNDGHGPLTRRILVSGPILTAWVRSSTEWVAQNVMARRMTAMMLVLLIARACESAGWDKSVPYSYECSLSSCLCFAVEYSRARCAWCVMLSATYVSTCARMLFKTHHVLAVATPSQSPTLALSLSVTSNARGIQRTSVSATCLSILLKEVEDNSREVQRHTFSRDRESALIDA